MSQNMSAQGPLKTITPAPATPAGGQSCDLSAGVSRLLRGHTVHGRASGSVLTRDIERLTSRRRG